MIHQLFAKKKRAFMPLYDEITEKIIRGEILTASGDRFSPATARNYESGAYRLRLFETECGRIYLEDMNFQWAERMMVFLMEKGYTKNTISGTMGRVKAVLRRLYNQGIVVYNGAGITSASEAVTTVFNTVEELRQLLNFDFSDTPGRERARDIYVMHCFLGLRYSDLAPVIRNPLRYIREMGGKYFFEIKTHKTGEVVVIPMSRVVRQIMDKYGYQLGRPFTYQYYNSEIKEIARQAGLTQDVIFTRTEGGQRVDTVRQKCELMSSHTARRTFATNAILAGLPQRNVMLITGHRTAQAFERYIRCNSLESAISISGHGFFDIELPVTRTLGGDEVLLLGPGQ